MRMHQCTKALYNIIGPIAVLVISTLGLVIYSKSLFMERSPIPESNEKKAPAIYKKGVILVMDGVRADAIHEVKEDKKTLYHDNFSVLERIPKKDVFKAVSMADLPTGTAMRILSTFSGIPTTLLSAQRSFHKQSSGVDNFIRQLQMNDRSFLFYGDETWTYLFPEIKKNIGEIYHPYGLIPFSEEERLIKQALEAHESKDYVIIHLISPDSYGHVYGTNSIQVKTALQMIDQFIHQLYSNMTDESFIAVLSDHGVNNDGSHGGTSLPEKAASFLFIAKDIAPEITTEQKVDKRQITQESNTHKKYKDELGELNIIEPVNIISQNDILPTLCAFMGLAVPYNSSGRLIPIIPEEREDIYFLELERQKTTLSHFYGTEYLKLTPKLSGSLLNEHFGDEIHKIFHKSSIFGMAVGVLFLLAGIMIQLALVQLRVFKLSFALSVFSISMVAHSVHSVIHEDVISLIMCMVLCYPFYSILSLIVLPVVSFVAGEFPLHSVDRVVYIRWIKKLPSRYHIPSIEKTLLFFSFAFFLAHWMRIPAKKYDLRSTGVVLFAVSQFFSLGVPHMSRSFSLFFSPQTLPMLLYTPLSALSFLYLFCPIVKKCVDTPMHSTQKGAFLFFLIKLMFFITGHNHALSSINWEAAFLFSRKSIPGVSAVFVGADLLLPFIYIAYTLGTSHLETLAIIVLLQGICAVIGWVVNFWFLGQSLMWFIFTGRTVFESFFFIAFLTAQLGLYVVALLPYKTVAFSKEMNAWNPLKIKGKNHGE
ncbi:GPI ethanolamine phosphate transferase 3 subunit O [Nematocida parisii]|nr:GPI ethanolamine phosphate transferase 3 subunit O [Nematocida parisii]